MTSKPIWTILQASVDTEGGLKQETAGVEESAVIVVECKEEIKEDEMETDDFNMKNEEREADDKKPQNIQMSPGSNTVAEVRLSTRQL